MDRNIAKCLVIAQKQISDAPYEKPPNTCLSIEQIASLLGDPFSFSGEAGWLSVMDALLPALSSKLDFTTL